MIRFLDGPAADVTLALRRAPALLRVVRHERKGEWDALDQPEDEPAELEQVFVYRRLGEPVYGFLDYRAGPKGGRRAGERFVQADYRVVSPQPAASDVEDNEAWQIWARQWAREHREFVRAGEQLI